MDDQDARAAAAASTTYRSPSRCAVRCRAAASLDAVGTDHLQAPSSGSRRASVNPSWWTSAALLGPPLPRGRGRRSTTPRRTPTPSGKASQDRRLRDPRRAVQPATPLRPYNCASVAAHIGRLADRHLRLDGRCLLLRAHCTRAPAVAGPREPLAAAPEPQPRQERDPCMINWFISMPSR
jgi:hypothetical protein